VLGAIEWRTNTRRQSLERVLAEREQAERDWITADLDWIAATLRGALADVDAEDALISRLEVEKSKEELDRYRRDRRPWADRRTRLDAERDCELATTLKADAKIP